MIEAIPYAVAAAAAITLLFFVPLAVTLVRWAIGAFLRDEMPRPGRPSLLAGARFAVAWTLLAFVPLGLLTGLAKTGGLFPWALALVATTGFVRAFLSSALKPDPFPWRFMWASLEAVLLANGFLLFTFTHDIF